MSAGVTILEFTGDDTKTAVINGETPHISVSGNFGGGTMALNQIINGNTVPVMDAGSPVTFTAGIDESIDFKPGHRLSFTLSSSTAPTVTVAISVIPSQFPVV